MKSVCVTKAKAYYIIADGYTECYTFNSREEAESFIELFKPFYKNKTKHPAVFPERLANDHILSWSNKGDVVLDPFCGSGTTAKMAMLTGRKFIGFEISAEYCDIAEKRIASVGKDIPLFEAD